MNKELERLIAHFGSKAALAEALGVTRQAVGRMVRNKAMPLDRARQAAQWGFDASKLLGL